MRKLNKKELEFRKQHMLDLRSAGWTYDDIALNVNLSKQRVFQIVGKANISYFRPFTAKQIVYKGLREWLNYHNVSRSELVRRMYGRYHPEISNRLAECLRGKVDLKKSAIDKILKVTGLTYEQTFGIIGD